MDPAQLRVTFTACRSKPEVVVPAQATPREVKPLSEVDNRPVLRTYMRIIEFFRCRREEPEASSLLKAALAEALVHYYPIAGRLREIPGGQKLVVDCTAEGVLFVEARADVRLEEFGQPLVPPYPCVDQLMCDVGDIVIGMPLLYLQLSRLRCGGLVLALSMCHSVVDPFGMVQVLRCIVDYARGQTLPAVSPVWERHHLTSSVASDLTEPALAPFVTDDDLVTRSFLFGPREIAALRVCARVGRPATVFELVAAAAWRCWAAALGHAPGERVRLVFTSNARGRWKRDPPLPPGFYGNALFITTAEAAAGELSSLAHVVDLVREAKLRVTDEHVRSVLDMMARGEHRGVEQEPGKMLMVSDITRCGDESLDLGWAERVGGGVPMAANAIAALMHCKDADGEDCIVVPMCLPELVMGRFASQIARHANQRACTELHVARSTPVA